VAGEWQQLQQMTDAQVIAAYERNMQNTVVGVQWWRDELLRRENARMARRMFQLTVAATLAAFASVLVSVAAVVVAAKR
jgi:lipopolysaccharide/colanic/teichoic acid biosynthesis glycosyltransferase